MRHGVKIRSHERCYRDSIKTLPISDQYFVKIDLPVSVLKGDLVQEGQVIVEDNGVDLLVHSPVTGIVQGIDIINNIKYVQIQANREVRARQYKMIDPFKLEMDFLLETLRKAGVIGIGSQEPLHRKIRSALKKAHTIVINGLDSEPFLSSQHQILSEYSKEMIRGADLLKTMVGADNIVIAMRKDSNVKQELDNFVFDTTIDIRSFSKRYPLGYDRLLVHEISGKTVLSSDNLVETGYFVLGASSLLAFYNALFLQKPMIENIITVDGIYCLEYGNFRVKIGTPISTFMRPFAGENSCNIFTRGPMHGYDIKEEFSISKEMNSVIISEQSEDPEEQECIACIACNTVCPISLEPFRLFDMANHEEWDLLRENSLKECISCNLCSYVCPCFISIGEKLTEVKNRLGMHGKRGL